MSKTNKVGEAVGNAVGVVGDVVGESMQSFGDLLKNFNVIGFVLGLLISTSVSEIANSFIEGVIMPTIQPLLDKITDKGSSIKIGGLTLHLEKLINSIFKFLALSLVIFIIMQFGTKITKPVQWVRIEQIKQGLKL